MGCQAIFSKKTSHGEARCAQREPHSATGFGPHGLPRAAANTPTHRALPGRGLAAGRGGPASRPSSPGPCPVLCVLSGIWMTFPENTCSPAGLCPVGPSAASALQVHLAPSVVLRAPQEEQLPKVGLHVHGRAFCILVPKQHDTERGQDQAESADSSERVTRSSRRLEAGPRLHAQLCPRSCLPRGRPPAGGRDSNAHPAGSRGPGGQMT